MFLNKSLFKNLFFIYSIDAAIIKNSNVPSCINCVHYKPPLYAEFSSDLSQCKHFGTKNIRTDKIQYDYVSVCRSDEEKCGLKGKYFEEEPTPGLKVFLHNFMNFLPFNFGFFILIINAYIQVLKQT